MHLYFDITTRLLVIGLRDVPERVVNGRRRYGDYGTEFADWTIPLYLKDCFRTERILSSIEVLSPEPHLLGLTRALRVAKRIRNTTQRLGDTRHRLMLHKHLPPSDIPRVYVSGFSTKVSSGYPREIARPFDEWLDGSRPNAIEAFPPSPPDGDPKVVERFPKPRPSYSPLRVHYDAEARQCHFIFLRHQPITGHSRYACGSSIQWASRNISRVIVNRADLCFDNPAKPRLHLRGLRAITCKGSPG